MGCLPEGSADVPPSLLAIAILYTILSASATRHQEAEALIAAVMPRLKDPYLVVGVMIPGGQNSRLVVIHHSALVMVAQACVAGGTGRAPVHMEFVAGRELPSQSSHSLPHIHHGHRRRT